MYDRESSDNWIRHSHNTNLAYLGCVICDYGIHGGIMICHNESRATHALGLMCQQIAALSISIIGHHNAWNESLVVNPGFTVNM